MLVPPYVAPFVAPTRAPVPAPAMHDAVDDVGLTGTMTAEYTTADLAFELAPFLEPFAADAGVPGGNGGFAQDAPMAPMESVVAADAAAGSAPVAEHAAHDDMPSIDAYLQRVAVAAVADAAESQADASPGRGSHSEALAPSFDADVAIPPFPAHETLAPAPVATGGLAGNAIERERQALVDAIVGAAVQAAAGKHARRDREIDHDENRLFAADPFEEPFFERARDGDASAVPSPFDDDADVISDVRSNGINDFSDSPYLVSLPVPAEPWSPPGITVRRRTPHRMTPVMSPRIVTPYSTPAIPYTPVVPPAPVPAVTPMAASMPTPRSVPAVPDVDGARAVAGALEAVAAHIRAGQLVIAGDVPAGTDQSTQAACLAVALAALLGVRH